MVIGLLFALVFIAAIVGLFLYGSKQLSSKEKRGWGEDELSPEASARNKKRSKNAIIAFILVVVCFLGLILVPFSWHTVDQSEVSVVKSLGKIKDTRTAGTYFDFWVLNSYTDYSTKVQEVNVDDVAYSSDAQQMTLKIKFQYQIMPDKIKEITTQYGNLETLEARITPTVRDRIKVVLSKHTAMSIIEKRESISSEAATTVTKALGDRFFVTVTNVAITDIEFSEQFETAVEDKMIAEQNQLKAEYENAAKVAKAEADAKAKILAAEGEAKANELLQKSLTDKILQEMYLDKWDGKLPQVVAGDDTSMILPSYNQSTTAGK